MNDRLLHVDYKFGLDLQVSSSLARILRSASDPKIREARYEMRIERREWAVEKCAVSHRVLQID